MSRHVSTRLLRHLVSTGQISSKASTSRIRIATISRHSSSAIAHYSTAIPRLTQDLYASLDNPEREYEEEDARDADQGSSQWIRFPKKRRPRRTLIVRNFDPTKTTLDDIKELLQPFGEIAQMNMHGKDICYVEFALLSSAQKAIYNHKSYPLRIHDQLLYVNYAVDVIQVGNPSNLLWVTGLDTSSPINLEELKEIFEEFGDVENIIPNRKGLPTCIIRYTSVEDAEYAIKYHQQKQRLRYRGLALQIRFSDSKPSTTRSPNPTLHVMGFSGTQRKLLSYIPEHAKKVKDVYLSNPIGDSMERRDVFIKFDSIESAEQASRILNRQLGLVAQYAWPKKPRST